MTEEIKILNKRIPCSEETHRLFKILHGMRSKNDDTFDDTLMYLLLNVEDIKQIADKEVTNNEG